MKPTAKLKNGKGASDAPATFRALRRALQNGVSAIAPLVAIACLGLWMGAPLKADAALYQDGTTSEQTTTMGLQFQGRALSFRIYSPVYGGDPGGQKNASATFINSRYAVTAYHNISDVLGSMTGLEVADGPNYKTNRGNVVAISEYIVHPSQDLVILKFAQPFFASSNQVIGTAAVDDIVFYAGYGTWGTPSAGIVRDGNLRAFDARIGDTEFYGPYYQTTRFGYGNLNGLTLNGSGRNGDSGGPAFNAQGEVIGIMIYASTAIASIGSTSHLGLGDPSIKAWIEANTALPAPVLDLRVSPIGPAMRLTWDADAIGYRLQTSDSLATWTNLGSVLTGPGTYDDPIAASPRQFYRLAKP